MSFGRRGELRDEAAAGQGHTTCDQTRGFAASARRLRFSEAEGMLGPVRQGPQRLDLVSKLTDLQAAADGCGARLRALGTDLQGRHV